VKQERKIIFYGSYFLNFYFDQSAAIQEKIDFVLMLIKSVERIPEKFFKYVEDTDAIYEVRIEYHKIQIRIFCCFDIGNSIILFNAFIKKKKQTPKRELELAIKLKKKCVLEREK